VAEPDLQLERTSRRPRTYELRTGDEVLGVLTYPHFMSDTADVRAADGRAWQLPGRSAFRRESPIVAMDGHEVGAIRRSWWRGGGEIVLGADSYELRRTSRWKSRWAVCLRGAELMRVRSSQISSKHPIDGTTDGDVDPLVALAACHLVLMSDRDEASAATAASG
jgi:hypothetical protein